MARDIAAEIQKAIANKAPQSTIDALVAERNQKIKDQGLTNVKSTDEIVNSAKQAAAPKTDIAAQIKAAVASGASAAEINSLVAQRDQKIKDYGLTGVKATADLLKEYGYTGQDTTMYNPGGSVGSGTISGPSLLGGQELASKYGINYDEDAILGKFKDATKASYDALKKEYDVTANQFYNQMGTAQQGALDTIRKSNAKAVATGASRGMQAANELSATLGLEQTASDTATQLAQDRNLLMDKQQAAEAQNVVDAMTTSNQLKNGLMSADLNKYSADTQYDVGKMQYYAALDAADKALQGSKYAADQSAAANMYAADQNLKGSQAYANASKSGSSGYDNSAQSAYYNALTKQLENTKAAPDLASTLDSYISTGNKNAYIITFRNQTGGSQAEAEKMWKQATEAKNALVKTTPNASAAKDIAAGAGNTGYNPGTAGITVPSYWANRTTR